jgi:uncharacterized protein (DUF433 family)
VPIELSPFSLECLDGRRLPAYDEVVEWGLVMEHPYVEMRDGGYWVRGTRVSLDSVVVAFVQGLSPEAIAAECFPTLTLEQVYGAITHYLAHRSEIDAYLKQADAEFESLRQATHRADPEFTRKLAEARRRVEMAVS